MVIPGRNCAHTLPSCLQAAVALRGKDGLNEIIFVDDHSTDDSAAIAGGFAVVVIPCSGRGPGAARNAGWRASTCPLVWFVDADCVAEPEALARLLPHLSDSAVAAVGGSYGNMRSESLLACLIHEEIVERHRSMPARVDFLATFNVLYRCEVLERLGGFDERFLKGQDAELSWRALEAGYQLAFEATSRVKHFHPVSWRSYLRTQRQQGYWRVHLHLTRRGHARGDAYSGLVDHLQPPLALVAALAMPQACWPAWWPVAPGLAAGALSLLLAAQIPMTARLVRRMRDLRFLAYAAMGTIRAFWRAWGMAWGVASLLRQEKHSPRPPT